MTRTRVAAPVDAPDVESALAVLREQGLRASTARRLVLETLYAADGLLTAEEIAGGLGGRLPRSDPASVYRILEVLEGVGLARHVHLGHGPGLYVRIDGPECEYMMCELCGSVREVEPAALDGVRKSIRRAFGHEARFTHFPLAGLCASCARKHSGAAPKKRRESKS